MNFLLITVESCARYCRYDDFVCRPGKQRCSQWEDVQRKYRELHVFLLTSAMELQLGAFVNKNLAALSSPWKKRNAICEGTRVCS